MGELNQADLKNAKHLKMFMDAHCNSTHYLFGRQSSMTSEAKAFDKGNKNLLIASNALAVIVCIDIMKPQCMYAAASLTPTEKKKCLKTVVNSRMYSCGCELFPPDHPLCSTVIVRQANCSEPMESQYYSATCVSFPPVCLFCSSPEMLAEDEIVSTLKNEFAVVRPICFLCRADGKRPATLGNLTL